MRKTLIVVVSHVIAAAIGFALGIYALPILTAPNAPSTAEVASQSTQALYTGRFRRDLKDSDLLHWGEGTVSVGKQSITLMGRLAPGPDYKLYLAPEFVETKDGFLDIKDRSRRIGDVKTFKGFIVDVPAGVDVGAYSTPVVWCESFSQFITAAKYR